jgi:DNA-binding winged helix-turn-helix (wHTH) protein
MSGAAAEARPPGHAVTISLGAVTVDGVGVGSLEPATVRVLLCIAAGRGRVVPTGTILDFAFARDVLPGNIHVRVCRIRALLGREAVETVWGHGFRLGPGWSVRHLTAGEPVPVMIPAHLVWRIDAAAERAGCGFEAMVEQAIAAFCGGAAR